MPLYYLILWNQVDILQKHFKRIMSICASGRGFTVSFAESQKALQQCSIESQKDAMAIDFLQ